MDYSNPPTPSQPPPGGPQPPQQQYQPQPGGYQAPPPPVPQKKGFNWLACCGISCVVIIILMGGMAFCTYQMGKPFMNIGMQVASLETAVRNADASAIRSNAVPVDPASLASDASVYQDDWLMLEGRVMDGASMAATGFSAGNFMSVVPTTYVLDGNVEVADISGKQAVGGPGDRIVAYGRCYGWDLSELEKVPFFGKFIAEGIKSDPSLAGNSKVVFFITKDVELAGTSSDDGNSGDPNQVAGDAPNGAGDLSGWLK